MEINGYEIKNNSDYHGANFRGADLRGADLSESNLIGADLTEANLSAANLRLSDLNDANLSGARLAETNFRGADIRGADLSKALLIRTNLIDANLSGAEGLLNPAEWIRGNFEVIDHEIIVYKVFGAIHRPPDSWDIKPGEYITEVVSPDRTNACGCGINVATLKWIHANVLYKPIWKCAIEPMDLATAIVPYNTDGMFRVGRIRLIEENEL